MILKIFLAFSLFIQATASAPVSHDLTESTMGPLVRVRVGKVIYRIPLESYLLGVIPAEMPASWPLESLKAQAVASRSFVLSQMEARRSLDFDVESTIHDQVFKMENLNYTGPFRSKVLKAVNETRSQVLFEPQKEGENDKVQKAYFHSDCGGSTETSFYIWRTTEPLQQVRDQSCPLGPNSDWDITLTLQEIEQSLELGKIKNIKMASKTPSGRAGTIMVELENGDNELLLAEVFRKRLGYNKLKSTLFKFTKEKTGEYVFKGRGHGHGVGMCQWGAKQLANQGSNYKQILSHYYPLSRLDSTQKPKPSLYTLRGH